VRRSAHTARRQPLLMVIALILMATFVAMIPFTDASAIDPTWLTGIYDDADYDEIVRLLTETSGIGTNPLHPAAASLTFITRIVVEGMVVEGMNGPPQRHGSQQTVKTSCSQPIALTDIIESNSGLLSHLDCRPSAPPVSGREDAYYHKSSR
jgi:hypothetical protein